MKPITRMQAVLDVAHERIRQVEREGFDAPHDDQHPGGDLAAAGSCYALSALTALRGQPASLAWPGRAWPWNPSWWKPRSPREDLVRAAALLIAEIDRLDRAIAQATRERCGLPSNVAPK